MIGRSLVHVKFIKNNDSLLNLILLLDGYLTLKSMNMIGLEA